MARPEGHLRQPSPTPSLPNLLRCAPSAEKTCIRWLQLSATYNIQENDEPSRAEESDDDKVEPNLAAHRAEEEPECEEEEVREKGPKPATKIADQEAPNMAKQPRKRRRRKKNRKHKK